MADNTGVTDIASTSATISSIAPPVATITISNQTIQNITDTYGINLEQQFYASDTNEDGIPDVFTDPNNVLTPVSLVNISGHVSFLLSTNNDGIPEFFWDTTNTMIPITHTSPPFTTPFIDTTARTVLIEITVNKTGWIYLDITDKYSIDEYPQYTFSVKTGNRTISPDRIWRKDGRIYVLDDPATYYDIIWGYTILPPTFYPASGTTINTSRPTITITYPHQVSLIFALLDTQNIMNQFTTIENKIFTFTLTTDLTKETHTLSLTAQEYQGNTLTSSSTYTVSFAEKSEISILWIVVIIIAIILVIALLLIYLRKQTYI